MAMASLMCLLVLASSALTLSLPKLFGPSSVGTVAFEVIDYHRLDPYAPITQPRALMVSVFYPVHHVRRYTLAPAFSHGYATFLDNSLGLASGTASSVITQAYEEAYLHTSSSSLPPVILFSPGFGNSRQDYAAALSDLASHGYIVVGVDHPYDTGFIEYPDGRNVTGLDLLKDPESINNAVLTRAKDVEFVLNALTTNATVARKIPGVHGRIKQSKFGIFGHSFGGATAAEAIYEDSRFECGANLDGAVFGPVVEEGFSKPFLIMNTEAHNRTSDPTLKALWDHLMGFKLELTVLNSTHGSFSDQAYLYEKLRSIDAIPDLGDLFGTIGGTRILEIEYVYLSAFFDKCLLGKAEPLLDGADARYPEVVFFPS